MKFTENLTIDLTVSSDEESLEESFEESFEESSFDDSTSFSTDVFPSPVPEAAVSPVLEASPPPPTTVSAGGPLPSATTPSPSPGSSQRVLQKPTIQTINLRLASDERTLVLRPTDVYMQELEKGVSCNAGGQTERLKWFVDKMTLLPDSGTHVAPDATVRDFAKIHQLFSDLGSLCTFDPEKSSAEVAQIQSQLTLQNNQLFEKLISIVRPDHLAIILYASKLDSHLATKSSDSGTQLKFSFELRDYEESLQVKKREQQHLVTWTDRQVTITSLTAIHLLERVYLKTIFEDRAEYSLLELLPPGHHASYEDGANGFCVADYYAHGPNADLDINAKSQSMKAYPPTLLVSANWYDKGPRQAAASERNRKILVCSMRELMLHQILSFKAKHRSNRYYTVKVGLDSLCKNDFMVRKEASPLVKKGGFIFQVDEYVDTLIAVEYAAILNKVPIRFTLEGGYKQGNVEKFMGAWTQKRALLASLPTNEDALSCAINAYSSARDSFEARQSPCDWSEIPTAIDLYHSSVWPYENTKPDVSSYKKHSETPGCYISYVDKGVRKARHPQINWFYGIHSRQTDRLLKEMESKKRRADLVKQSRKPQQKTAETSGRRPSRKLSQSIAEMLQGGHSVQAYVHKASCCLYMTQEMRKYLEALFDQKYYSKWLDEWLLVIDKLRICPTLDEGLSTKGVIRVSSFQAFLMHIKCTDMSKLGLLRDHLQKISEKALAAQMRARQDFKDGEPARKRSCSRAAQPKAKGLPFGDVGFVLTEEKMGQLDRLYFEVLGSEVKWLRSWAKLLESAPAVYPRMSAPIQDGMGFVSIMGLLQFIILADRYWDSSASDRAPTEFAGAVKCLLTNLSRFFLSARFIFDPSKHDHCIVDTTLTLGAADITEDFLREANLFLTRQITSKSPSMTVTARQVSPSIPRSPASLFNSGAGPACGLASDHPWGFQVPAAVHDQLDHLYQEDGKDVDWFLMWNEFISKRPALMQESSQADCQFFSLLNLLDAAAAAYGNIKDEKTVPLDGGEVSGVQLMERFMGSLNAVVEGVTISFSAESENQVKNDVIQFGSKDVFSEEFIRKGAALLNTNARELLSCSAPV